MPNYFANQLTRYLLIGLLNNFFLYALYVFLTYCSISPYLAATSSYCLGILIAFFSNKKWTFAYEGSLTTSCYRAIISYGIAYIINMIFLYLFINQMGISHLLAQAFCIIISSMFLFLMFKYFVFPSPTISFEKITNE